MERHGSGAGEESRVIVGSALTVYHRRPVARGAAAGIPGRKASAAAGAHPFLGPACGAAREIADFWKKDQNSSKLSSFSRAPPQNRQSSFDQGRGGWPPRQIRAA